MTETMWLKMFGDNLTSLMREVGYSQKELAEDTGLSESTISRYMNGKATPSGYNLERLADALKCSISELTKR